MTQLPRISQQFSARSPAASPGQNHLAKLFSANQGPRKSNLGSADNASNTLCLKTALAAVLDTQASTSKAATTEARLAAQSAVTGALKAPAGSAAAAMAQQQQQQQLLMSPEQQQELLESVKDRPPRIFYHYPCPDGECACGCGCFFFGGGGLLVALMQLATCTAAGRAALGGMHSALGDAQPPCYSTITVIV